MATNDVPGHNPGNMDKLHKDCWAEHEDGSLIYVAGLFEGSVIFHLFDVAEKTDYRDAMVEADFKKHFSFGGKSGEKWTWHDKSAFPWDRVMGIAKSGVRPASADDVLSAAARVARSMSLKGVPLDPDKFGAGQPTEQATKLGQAIADIIQSSLDRFRR
jgi:hypothetical protein